MAISFVYREFEYRVNQLIEDAALDAGIVSSMLTADLLQRGMRALNLLLSSMPNLRIYTWQQRQILIPIYENDSRVNAPTDTFNLLDRVLRTPTRMTGTLTSSAGGTIAYADDDDFDTVLTQTSATGNVQIQLGTAAQLYEIGILWGATATVTAVIERSDDGTTWYQVTNDAQTIEAVDREWWWFAPEGAIPSLYWRVRLTSGTLVAREIYFGGPYSDIPISPLNRNQYMQLPIKTQPGRPLQAWLDRQRNKPVLRLWYPPSRAYRYCHIAAIQQQMLADVTSLRETLDVPQRYLDAIRAALAVRICRTWQEADKKRLPDLIQQMVDTQLPAITEDRDGSPIMAYPNIRGYT